MQVFETSSTVLGQGEVHVAGVPFAPGTEVEVTITPISKSAEEFAAAWERVCREIRAAPAIDKTTDGDIQMEIDRYRAGQ